MKTKIHQQKLIHGDTACIQPSHESGKTPLHLIYSPILICNICIFLLSGCGMVSTAEWITFSDSLGQGSEVIPKQGIINLNGIVEARITKSSDPEWVPDKDLDYPYAGIMMKFWRSGKSIDISESSGLSIEYVLDGHISMRLIQKNIPAGQEYLIELPPQHIFQAQLFHWERFSQPDWVNPQTPIDLSSITGVMFTNSSEKRSTAYLSIKEMTFTDWENPYGFKNIIRNIGVHIN